MQTRFALLGATVIAAFIAHVPHSFGLADEPATPKAGTAYTLDEALQQLSLYPKDPYLQYVALQLARRENRQEEVAGQIERSAWGSRWSRRPGRREDVDLFSVFTGALAVQESLQLDTMRGQGPGRGRPGAQPAQGAPPAAQQGPVEIASLIGPTIKSHPWDEMLAGKKPDIGPLARCVPDDFFFAEFGSLNKLLDVLDSGNLWSKHLLNQTTGEARSQEIGERLKKQLALETNPLVRPFYDLVVEDVAVTGNDLFFNEGSDVTLLFRFKQPAVFKARMDGFLQAAQKADPTISRQTGRSNRIDYVHLSNPERTVHVFSAYPEANLHVRSNSLAALERVLGAIRGSTAEGERIRRLGETSEFGFIRTLMPRGAKEEDGFIYLSDPFIRKLVGPEVKLTERRRVLCYNHLRMIGHASLMYRSESGHLPESVAAIEQARCSPGLFGRDDLACPDGGVYSLSADGVTGVCSHHGPCQELVPCIEHSLATVTGAEAEEYKAFVTAYNQYWRTFFDPIGIRIKVAPEQYRLETIILPLIDNSVYSGLAAALGGRPEPLDAFPLPKRNIFSVNFRFDKEGLAEKAGLKVPEPSAAPAELAGNNVPKEKTRQNLAQIGLAMHNYHDVQNGFPAQARCDKNGKPLLSWRVLILPYLDQAQLYNEFHLDEPWDSEHNKKLVERMPAIYQGLAPSASKPGKTTYLAPVGKDLMFTGEEKGVPIASVADGTSNTIFIVQADDEHAVTWTKPDDLEVDLENPASGLAIYEGMGSPVLFVDGSFGFLREGIDAEKLALLLTRNDGQQAFAQEPEVIRDQPRRNVFSDFGLDGQLAERLDLARLLLEGLGNQVGLHSYDALPLFDLNLPDLLGQSLTSFSGNFDNGFLMVGFLVASFNAPVYVSIPVQNAAIVDEFLDKLDTVFAARAREPGQRGWFELDQDFYRFSTASVPNIRCQSLGFGPVKFRVFWARIGTGLYIASKPFILDDLAAAAANAGAGRPGHAMFKIRARNWDQVLPEYRLGWAENNRRACLDNLGPLLSVSRALAGTDSSAEVCRCADRLHGAHFFCPEGGRYLPSADGRMVACSVHGTALAPKQQAAPADEQPLAKLLRTFTGLEATLTFLEDGLHAVVTIDRK